MKNTNLYCWMYSSLGEQISILAYTLAIKKELNLKNFYWIKEVNYYSGYSTDDKFSYNSILDDYLSCEDSIILNKESDDEIVHILNSLKNKKEQDDIFSKMIEKNINKNTLFIYDLRMIEGFLDEYQENNNVSLPNVNRRLSNIELLSYLNKSCSISNIDEYINNFNILNKKINIKNRIGILLDAQEINEVIRHDGAINNFGNMVSQIQKIKNSSLYIYCPSKTLYNNELLSYIDSSNDVYFDESVPDDIKVVYGERGNTYEENLEIQRKVFQVYYNLSQCSSFIGTDVPYSDTLLVRFLRLKCK